MVASSTLVVNSCMMVVNSCMMVVSSIGAGRLEENSTLVVSSTPGASSKPEENKKAHSKLVESSLDNTMAVNSRLVESSTLVADNRNSVGCSKLAHSKLVENKMGSRKEGNSKLVVNSCKMVGSTRSLEDCNKSVGCSKLVGCNTLAGCSKLVGCTTAHNRLVASTRDSKLVENNKLEVNSKPGASTMDNKKVPVRNKLAESSTLVANSKLVVSSLAAYIRKMVVSSWQPGSTQAANKKARTNKMVESRSMMAANMSNLAARSLEEHNKLARMKVVNSSSEGCNKLAHMRAASTSKTAAGSTTAAGIRSLRPFGSKTQLGESQTRVLIRTALGIASSSIA